MKNGRIPEDRRSFERERSGWMSVHGTHEHLMEHANLSFVSGYLCSHYLVGDLFQPSKRTTLDDRGEISGKSEERHRYVSDTYLTGVLSPAILSIPLSEDTS